MKKSFLFTLFAIIMVMFNSCKESEEITATANDPKYYTTANNLSILKEDALDYIENAVTNDSLIVFRAKHQMK